MLLLSVIKVHVFYLIYCSSCPVTNTLLNMGENLILNLGEYIQKDVSYMLIAYKIHGKSTKHVGLTWRDLLSVKLKSCFSS